MRSVARFVLAVAEHRKTVFGAGDGVGEAENKVGRFSPRFLFEGRGPGAFGTVERVIFPPGELLVAMNRGPRLLLPCAYRLCGPNVVPMEIAEPGD